MKCIPKFFVRKKRETCKMHFFTQNLGEMERKMLNCAVTSETDQNGSNKTGNIVCSTVENRTFFCNEPKPKLKLKYRSLESRL